RLFRELLAPDAPVAADVLTGIARALGHPDPEVVIRGGLQLLERWRAREVILGGAGLAGLAARIQPHCPVPLLDSVEVGARAARDALDQAARDPLEVRQSSTFTGAAEAAVATVGLDPALARLISGGAKTPGRN
ncbi:MAG: aspartate/glutamate racemase family protein, partial [bacterium]